MKKYSLILFAVTAVCIIVGLVKVDVINGDIELNTEGPIDLNKVSVNTLNGNLYINGKEIGD